LTRSRGKIAAGYELCVTARTDAPDRKATHAGSPETIRVKYSEVLAIYERSAVPFQIDCSSWESSLITANSIETVQVNTKKEL
jgi:hypothetical protein